jgi:hypothetical protein
VRGIECLKKQKRQLSLVAHKLGQGLPVTGGVDKNFSMRETWRVCDAPWGSRYGKELGVEIECDELAQGLKRVVSPIHGRGGDFGVSAGQALGPLVMRDKETMKYRREAKGQSRRCECLVVGIPATRVDG